MSHVLSIGRWLSRRLWVVLSDVANAGDSLFWKCMSAQSKQS